MKKPLSPAYLFIFLAFGQIHCYLSVKSINDQNSVSKWLYANNVHNHFRVSDIKNVELENIPIENKDNLNLDSQSSTCQLIPIIHLLHQNGCQPKAIASFACSGTCASYIQVSTSKWWQYERSCSCCQQTGLQEATFILDCPSLEPPYRRVKTYAPVDCICRACTDLGKENLQPQELVEALAGESGKV